MKRAIAAFLVAGAMVLPGCGGESECEVLAAEHKVIRDKMAAISEKQAATDINADGGEYNRLVEEYNALLPESNRIGQAAKEAGCDPMDFIG